MTSATTPATWRKAFVCYSVSIPEQSGIFYIGACKLSDLATMPDAKGNAAWKQYMRPNDAMTVSILRISDNPDDAREMRDSLSSLAYCNRTAETMPPPLGRSVRCVDTGMVFESAAQAGEYFGVSRQAISQHLNLGRPKSIKAQGDTSGKRYTFQRVTDRPVMEFKA